MASLTKLASLTGNEEFQVSATQKVTAQQIADLAPKGVNSVVVTNFGSKTWTGGKTMTQMALGEIQAFTCAAGATGAPTNTAYGGIMQKTTASSLTYYACNPMSTNGGKSIWIATVLSVGSGITWNKISYDSEQGVPIMEVGDFTTINDVWPTETEPGRVAAFYTGTEVYSQPEAGETQYVGFVILDSDFNDNFSATVIAFARSSGKQYIGRLGFTEQVIDWYQYPTNPITLMSFRDLMSTTTFADMKQGEMKAFYSPNAGGADAPSGYSSSLFGYIQKTNTPAGIWIFAYGNTGNASAERKMWIGFATSSATQWTAVGGGGDGMEIINVPMGGDIGSIVGGANWKYTGMDGEMKAVFILDPASVVGDYFPNLKSASTLAGFAQCVYDGSDYQDFIVTLYPYYSSGALNEHAVSYGRILVNTSGDVIDYKEYPDCKSTPIPGYSTLVSSWSSGLTASTTGIINFGKEVSKNARILVTGTIRSSPVATATVRAAIPLGFLATNSTGNGAVFEMTSMYLGQNTTPGSIKLIITSVITGAYGITGLNVMVQSNNLGNMVSGDIMQLSLYCNE